MSEQNGFIKTIEIKDRNGRVIETREVVTYAGLLNRAHQEGLKSIRTRLVQRPLAENEMTAISLAEVVTDKGVFRDYGDANPQNVDSRIVPHIIRMSITRAKARALRDAINVGVISMEELGREIPTGNVRNSGNGNSPPTGAYHYDSLKPMTGNQRKYLFKLLLAKGLNAEEGHDWLSQECDVDDVKKITKKQASDLIDRLVNETSKPEEQSAA